MIRVQELRKGKLISRYITTRESKRTRRENEMKATFELSGSELAVALDEGTLAPMVRSVARLDSGAPLPVTEAKSPQTPEKSAGTKKKTPAAKPAPELPKEEPEGSLEDEESSGGIGLEQFRERLARVNKAGHLEAVRALLADAGYAKVSDVKPEDYEQLAKDAEALL
jgi:hypothetical protein